MKIIKPKKLNKGDVVMIVSPSNGIPKKFMGQFNSGIKFLENLGLKVKISKNALGKYFYSSGTIKERLEDIHKAFADKDVKAIIMSTGGKTANNLLDGLDFDLIKKNPKIFSGISDGTTLLNPIFSKTGLVTYHGPDLVFGFGLPMSSMIKKNLIETWFEGSIKKLDPNLNWKGLDELNKNIEYKFWQCVRKGKASGKLIGGNTSCLVTLDGTNYRPNYKDSILFLEAFLPDINELDRVFTHFRQTNIFDEINGLILGHFYGSHLADKKQDREVRDLILEITKDYSFPILEIGEIGHNVENYIMPIGCNVTINATKKTILINENTVI